MRRTNRIRISTLVTAGTLVLATSACGGQGLGDTSGTSSSGGTVVLDKAPAEDKAAAVINAINPDEALTAKVPPQIKTKGLKMTTSEGYPPMELFASDGKTLIGLDPSLGRAIARKLGVKISIANEDFNAQIPGIVTGRYDILMSSMTDNAGRQAKVSFVDYVQAGAGFIVKKGNPTNIKSPTDLCGKTVSVVDNGSSLDLAKTYNADCTKGGKPAVNILKYSGDQDALLQVKSGRAQVNITDYVVAAYKASDSKNDVEAIAIKGTESPWGIAMNPNNKDVISSVQGALDALIKSGEYQKVLDAWNLGRLTVPSAVVNGGK